MSYIELLFVAWMILVNGMFASYEIALASVSMSRLQPLANQGKGGALAAMRMKDGIEKSLAVVQLGITILGLTAGATGGASASEDIAPVLRAVGVSPWTADILAISLWVLPLTILTIVVGELVPKLFALRNKEWVCLTLSPWMWWFSIGTWPVIWVLEWGATQIMDGIATRPRACRGGCPERRGCSNPGAKGPAPARF